MALDTTPPRPSRTETDQQRAARLAQDTAGLRAAYRTPERWVVVGNTLYVAGTSRPQDVVDDLLLPSGGITWTRKWREVEHAFLANQHVTRVVGHSLGAAAAHELKRKYHLRYHLYANPGFNFGRIDPNITRHNWDFISLFDRRSQSVPSSSMNPHAYT